MTFPRAILRRALAPALGLVVMQGGAGCFRPPPILDPSFPRECRVGPADWRTADSVRVAHPVAGMLDRERRLASWILAMPIYVDCYGDVRPGFASGWTRRDGGRCWSLTIRSGLRFTSGEKLTADAVATRWHSRIEVLDAGVDSVAAAGDRVEVHFRRKHSDIPRVLSDNAFGLHLKRWPDVGLLRQNHRDLRDELEDDVDIMVTLDNDVVDYAWRHERFTVTELPYDRVYVLLCGARADAIAAGEDLPGLTEALRESLAANAVRVSARAANSAFWWEDVDNCAAPSEIVPWLPPSGSGALKVVYEDGDPIARGIAERIVALASAPNTEGYREIEAALPGLHADIQAIGTLQPEFDHAYAYIVALPAEVADPCYERFRLIERVHWLLAVENDLSRALLPLVEAHPYAIFRTGAPALSVDRFGNTRVVR